VRDFHQAPGQIGGLFGPLIRGVGRSRAAEARKALGKAQEVFDRLDPDLTAARSTFRQDGALAYAHRALGALLRQYRMPIHDAAAFERFYDVASVPFR